MHAILFSLVALFCGIGILLVGNGLLGTLLGVRSVSLGFSLEVTGMVMAAYFAGFIAGSLRCVDLIERTGHIRTFAALAAVASAAALAHVLLESPFAWAILRFIMGFCFAGLYMVMESWLNGMSDNTSRGRILSIYMMVNLGSLAAGQFFLFLPDPGGFALFCIASMLMSLALVPITLSSLFRTSPLGLAGSFASGLGLGPFWSMAPVFCSTLGLSETLTAIFMSSTIIGGVLLLWPIGRMSDTLDRRRVITILCAASALSSLLIILVAGTSPLALFGLAMVWGGFSFPIYSISVAHTNDFLKSDDLLSASSGLLLVYGAGAILGPLLSGLAMGYLGASGLYVWVAGVMGTMVAFSIYRTSVRDAPPAEERAAIVFVPRTTHVAYELDPRVSVPENEPT
ncbi:MAG: MFS transporter [Alphaproteobacteria bacterium]|nr:MFS transporter [Alphaproteobacteria bacterium]